MHSHGGHKLTSGAVLGFVKILVFVLFCLEMGFITGPELNKYVRLVGQNWNLLVSDSPVLGLPMLVIIPDFFVYVGLGTQLKFSLFHSKHFTKLYL